MTIGAVDANPASGNQEEEFIELINPGATAVDISGWQIQGGVSHTLKPGSVLLPGGSLYLARRASAFRARTSGPRGGEGRFVQGNYAGSISARGEALRVRADVGLAQRAERAAVLIVGLLAGGLLSATWLTAALALISVASAITVVQRIRFVRAGLAAASTQAPRK